MLSSSSELLRMDEARRHFAERMSGRDIHCDRGLSPGEGYSLLGRRMPDLDVVTAGSWPSANSGPLRVCTLLHDARPVLLNLGEHGGPGGFDITPWAHRVMPIDLKYAGNRELPVLNQVAACHRHADQTRLIRCLGRRGGDVGKGTDT